MDVRAARVDLVAAFATALGAGWHTYPAPPGAPEPPFVYVDRPTRIVLSSTYVDDVATFDVTIAVPTAAGPDEAHAALDDALSAALGAVVRQLAPEEPIEVGPYRAVDVGEGVALSTTVSLTVTV